MAADLVIAPEVEQDLAEASAWYESRRTGLGEELLSCVDACIAAICRMPGKPGTVTYFSVGKLGKLGNWGQLPIFLLTRGVPGS